jgi:SAM-dependent methyltransferase
VDARLAAYLELAETADEAFVRHLYRLGLRRDPEPEALDRALTRLADGTLSRATLLAELAGSEEFARVRGLDDAIAFAAWARRSGERPRRLTAAASWDDRLIELPWTLARYRGERRVLDVGYAFAEPAYLAALVELGAPELVGVDLSEADVPGMRTLRADVRSLPFRDGSFDVAFCISTLEHVGRDNRRYGFDEEPDEHGMRAALSELRRVLRRGGRLLLTVPCGEPQELGWYVQLDPAGWRRVFEEGGFSVVELEFYEQRADGWRAAPADPARPLTDGCLCAELRPGWAFRRMLGRAGKRHAREAAGRQPGGGAHPRAAAGGQYESP